MARKKAQEKVEEKVAEFTEEVKPSEMAETFIPEGTPIEVPKPNKISFEVFSGEAVIRVYSVAEHGEKAEALAREFAAKKGYQVR